MLETPRILLAPAASVACSPDEQHLDHEVVCVQWVCGAYDNDMSHHQRLERPPLPLDAREQALGLRVQHLQAHTARTHSSVAWRCVMGTPTTPATQALPSTHLLQLILFGERGQPSDADGSRVRGLP